jgi:hypothetical protein
MPIGNKAYSVGKGITKKGYPSHIPNKSGGMYGEPNEAGFRIRKGELNQFDINSWEDLKPTSGTR